MKTLIIANIPQDLNIQIKNKEIVFADQLSEEDAFNREYNNPQIVYDVPLESLKDALNLILTNNKNLVIESITYYETEQKLIIDTNNNLNTIAYKEANALQEIIYESKRVSSFLKELTFIENNKNKNIEEYISIYELLDLLSFFVQELERISSLENNCEHYLRTKGLKFDSFNIDYEDYLYNGFMRISLVIKVAGKEDYRYLINKELISELSNSTSTYGSICREIYKVFDVLDDVKIFMNFNEKYNIQTNRKGTFLNFDNKELIYGNEDFYFKRDLLNDDNSFFAKHYKDFKLLEKNTNAVLKSVYIQIADCPFFIQERIMKSQEQMNEKEKTKLKGIRYVTY